MLALLALCGLLAQPPCRVPGPDEPVPVMPRAAGLFGGPDVYELVREVARQQWWSGCATGFFAGVLAGLFLAWCAGRRRQ